MASITSWCSFLLIIAAAVCFSSLPVGANQMARFNDPKGIPDDGLVARSTLTESNKRKNKVNKPLSRPITPPRPTRHASTIPPMIPPSPSAGSSSSTMMMPPSAASSPPIMPPLPSSSSSPPIMPPPSADSSSPIMPLPSATLSPPVIAHEPPATSTGGLNITFKIKIKLVGIGVGVVLTAGVGYKLIAARLKAQQQAILNQQVQFFA